MTASSSAFGLSAGSLASPSARLVHDMAYDVESDRIVLFGGCTAGCGGVLGDTWSYDFNTNTWRDMDPVSAPSSRSSHAMAYDSGSDRIILHGGVFGRGETWAYNFNTNTWTNVSPTFAPGNRHGHRMVYDSESDRIILFGGHVGAGLSATFFNDTWAYDYDSNTWTNMTPATGPATGDHNGLVYDAESDRVFYFGGFRKDLTLSDETWTYNFNTNTWTNMNPGVRPSGRSLLAMAYDGQSDRVVIHGGNGGADETWVYNLNQNSWAKMSPALRPSVRLSHRAEYDSQSDRIVLFGGSSSFGGPSNNETWAYDFETNTWTPMIVLPTAPQNLGASPRTLRIDLAWNAPSFEGSSAVSGYRIYRGTSLGTISLFADLGTVLTYRDTNVTAGTTYYYQVSAVSEVGESPRSNLVFVAPTPDTTNPTVAINSPPNGATLNATAVTVTGIASDDVAVEKVELSLDGTTWIAATGTTSWSTSLTLQEGSNTITARGTDTSGNSATTSITVTVQVAPPPPPPPPWLLIGAGAAGVAAAGVVAGLVIRRRKKAG